MRILIIDEEFPWPLNTGKRLRTYNLTRELARYNQISYLAYGNENSDAFRHFQEIGLQPSAVQPKDRRQSGVGFYLRLLANLLSPYPYIVTSHYSKRFRDRVDKLIESAQFDLVICEWTPYAIFLKGLSGVKKVIVAHNIESAIWRRYEQNEQNALKRWYISVQRKKVEGFEQACFGWVDGATAVSDVEADTLKSISPSLAVTVVDNGVDTSYFAPAPAESVRASLVFTGSMDWRPNQDAAAYFVHDIWPIIRQAHPEVNVFFVGRDPSPATMELARQGGVVITGTVDDVRPYMTEASVYIVPLRIGGGSRLKILEALAMKKAVVSTRVGAEGLKVVDGQHVLLADMPVQFAAAVHRCLTDRSLRVCLGENGRKLVEDHYQWEQLGKKYHEFLATIVQS